MRKLIARRIKGAWVVLRNTVAISSISLLLLFFGLELRRELVVIEPFAVPEDLAKNGLTPEVVAQRLREQINAINDGANTTIARPSFATKDDLSDIAISENGFTFRRVLGIVREADVRLLDGVLTRPIVRIDGRLPREPSWRASPPPREACLTETAIKERLAGLARDVVWTVQPYLLASLEYGRKSDEAKRLAKLILGFKSQADLQYLHALNLIGIIHDNQKEWDSAQRVYERVLEIDPRFATAHINLGDTLNNKVTRQRRRGSATRRSRATTARSRSTRSTP
jgi:tetratricopeptide (TPR) repeat protein